MISSTELFRYFYYTARFGNISEAARALYTSQPVVSKYIHRLESELGVSLFIRSSRGVSLTEEGELLYEHVKTAFNYLDAGTQALAQQRELGLGQLRIGVSTTLCKYLLLPYLNTYIEQNPNIKISIYCQSTNQTLDLLEQNKIDIGLIGKPEDTNHMIFYDMAEIEDVFVATPSYMKKVQDDYFQNATFMLLDQANITRQYVDQYMKTHHILPNNILEVSTMDLIIEFSKIGMGIGCVIKAFVKDELEKGILSEIPLEIPISKRRVGFAIRNNNYRSRALELFLNMMNFR